MNPLRVGGEGLHVEIDESLFVLQKANVGRLPPRKWENNNAFCMLLKTEVRQL